MPSPMSYSALPCHIDATNQLDFFEAPPPYSEIPDTRYESTPPYTEVPVAQSAGMYPDQYVVTRRSCSLSAIPANDTMNAGLPRYTPRERTRSCQERRGSNASAVIMFNSVVTNLPPILTRSKGEAKILNNPDIDTLVKQIHNESEVPVSFIVNKNLVVRVKIINMNCCVEKKCWCFVSDGMGASNQEEVVILVKCNSFEMDETDLLRKVLQQVNFIFEKGKCGHTLNEYDVIEFHPDMMCMPKNAGMLFYRPTMQCLQKLPLPSSTYLFGTYVEDAELPWARNMPLRLLLRLGAEFKYYPCPLFNVLNRPTVFHGFDGTILKTFADFNTFMYNIPRIPGVTVNLRGEDIIIMLPIYRSDAVLKAVNNADETISLAGNFSLACDGHLVCVEKGDAYKTQTLSLKLKENRKVTCATFCIMTSSLKSIKDGIQAKSSIIEDGVMVEVTAEIMNKFKAVIKEKKNCSVTANCKGEGTCQISVEWCSVDTTERRLRKKSPIDSTSFDNCTNMKIRHGYDYTANNVTEKIHLVEIHFIPLERDKYISKDSAQVLGQMVTSQIAEACMNALSPHLLTLVSLKMTRIGLRINLSTDVEYKIGSNLTTLPLEVLSSLDEKLIPAIHHVMSRTQELVAIELIFHVVKIV